MDDVVVALQSSRFERSWRRVAALDKRRDGSITTPFSSDHQGPRAAPVLRIWTGARVEQRGTHRRVAARRSLPQRRATPRPRAVHSRMGVFQTVPDGVEVAPTCDGM